MWRIRIATPACVSLSVSPGRLERVNTSNRLLISEQVFPQASTEVIDDTVCNAHVCGLETGDVLAREGERISLTVRRVQCVMPRLLRL